MLKFKITPKHKKLIYIFQTAKALYDWMHDPNNFDEDNCVRIHVEPGEFAEYEWCGAEYIDEKNTQVLNLIKFVAAKRTKNESGYIHIPVLGWVYDGTLPVKSYEDNVIKVEKIIHGLVDFDSEFEGCEIT